LTGKRVFIAGVGIISPLGSGLTATEQALWKNHSAVKPITLFSLRQNAPLPVGEVEAFMADDSLPRTHQLALQAAGQAMQNSDLPLDAVVLGTTTGGILSTEMFLAQGEQRPEFYRFHGLTSVCEEVAGKYGCAGPALTVSTACSSGAVAIKIALEMLRTGEADRVLVGGVDSLCRLTYFGFNSLQLVDAAGSRPLDKNRKGMTVAEGAAMLLLTVDETEQVIAEVRGAGLSCDAYHPAAPHPQGQGALKAMENAIQDAGLSKSDIGYISLHGTGTLDNDLAEARAVNTLFDNDPPPLSSIKGATGHSLAAAGAIEAVVSALVIARNLLPANTRLREVDPALFLEPLKTPRCENVSAVLSNSFGFGGNNASLVIAQANRYPVPPLPRAKRGKLTIVGSSCLTGAGNKHETMAALWLGQVVAGALSSAEISAHLPAREIRRLKRLPRIALSLAAAAYDDSGMVAKPEAVFMGTGWGALSETYDFLTRLNETDEQFPSPTDFVGSVHNGPASQVAIRYNCTGANITTSGGNYSFEQALMCAELLADSRDESIFVLGADEGHRQFSHLFDQSIQEDTPLVDGGGGFCLSKSAAGKGVHIRTSFYKNSKGAYVLEDLVEALGGAEQISAAYGVLMIGIPAAFRRQGDKQLSEFMKFSSFAGPVIDYRQLTGEFASASAVAAVMALEFLKKRAVPKALAGAHDATLNQKGVLLLGLGQFITAMELHAP
jgi:3-oxoacyl-(acyl-carrier-protein) synthase